MASPLLASNPFSAPASTSTVLWNRLEARRPLPLRFILHLSRRPNASLCPCLEVDLPSPSPPSGVFTVTRILDPEHRTPYITLSPLFHSSGLTLIQGLLRFSLPPTSFSLSLAGLEPFDDIWVSLPLARSIASSLDLLHALSALLDPRTALAWSLDESSEGLSHNWRIPQQWIDAASYSTDAITDPNLKWGEVKMLPRGQQVKTLISGELRARVVRREGERRKEKGRKVGELMVRWTSMVWSIWWDVQSLLEEGEGKKARRLKELMEDLKGVAIPPTTVDMMEWMQIFASAELNRTSQPTKEGVALGGEKGAEETLEPLSLGELLQLRSTNESFVATLPSLPSDASADEIDEAISRLHLKLRAKMASLHRMNLLSLSLLSSSPPELGTEAEERQGSLNEDQQDCQGETKNFVQEGPNKKLAALNEKVDNLTTKLDALVEAQVSRKGLFPRARGQAVFDDGHQPEISSASCKEADAVSNQADTTLDAFSSAISTLNSTELTNPTPSMALIVLSIALFIIIVKSSID